MAPTGCALARVAHVVAPEQVASFLPAGFVPREAEAYLGPVAPAGNALVVTGALTCPSAAHDPAGLAIAEVAIFVQRPEVPGDRAEADEDFYVPSLLTTGRLLALAQEAGWVAREVAVRVQVEPLPAGALAMVSVSTADDDQSAMSFDVAGAATAAHQGLERYWHDAVAGIGYVEARTDIDQRAGTARCTFPAGSVAAQVVGATSCTPGTSFGLAVVGGSWTYRFVTLPGVHAG